MKTEILKIKGDWQEVVDDCRATVGKESLGKEPSEWFRRALLIAEHSPIRDISIKWRWQGVKSWIATHWVRHKWECFVQTQRSDRTGVDRDKLPQSALVNFTGEANAHALIDTMRKRLCRQASKETREYAEDFKRTLHEVQPELSDVLVPHCVYRSGCPEMHPCRFFETFRGWCMSKHGCEVMLLDISERYAMYNEFFEEMRGKYE